jgi:hypothetical protein
MDRTISVKKIHEPSAIDEELVDNPADSLDLVERLRIEAGKFLYDYPTAFRRVVTVVRREQR